MRDQCNALVIQNHSVTLIKQCAKRLEIVRVMDQRNKEMKTSLRKIAVSLAISVVALAGISANAGPVNVDVNVIVPGIYQAPQPVYVLPSPVYVQPRPVYVQPQAVYVQEQPAYLVQEERYWDCKKDKCKHKKLKKEKHQKHDRDDD